MTHHAHDPDLHHDEHHDEHPPAHDPDARQHHDHVGEDDLPPPAPWVVPRWLALTWVAGGVLGIVAALAGGILGTIFVGSATDTALEALAVTEAVLDGVDDTATALDTTSIRRGSNGAGMIYSSPNWWVTP